MTDHGQKVTGSFVNGVAVTVSSGRENYTTN